MPPNESSVLVRLRLLGGSRFASEAKGAATGLGTIDKVGKGVAARMTGVNKVLGASVAVLKRTAMAAGVLGAAGLAYGIKQSVSFEKAMAGVQARLLTTGGNMDKLRAQALDLGAKTQFSAGQAADAMGVLAQQGFSTQQIMKVLPGTLSLAAASGTDLASAARIQTETLHGFSLAAGQAGMVADVLAQVANKSAADIDDMQESLKYIAPVAHATGQSLSDVGAAIGLMANVGIKGSQAGTTLRTAMVRLSNPTLKARGALKDLGLRAGDLAGPKGLLSLPNIMGKIVKGSQGVSKNTRNAAIATIFGREALSGMVSLVEAGPKKFNRMSDALDHSRGAAKRAADIMRNTVAGAWDNFTGSVETAAIMLLHGFQPAMQGALNKASDFVNVGAKAAGAFGKGFSSGIQAGPAPRRVPGQAMEPRTVKNLSGAAGAGAQLRAKLQPVVAWLQSNLPKAGKAIVKVGAQFVDAFKPALPFFQNVLLPLVKGIAIGVVGAFLATIPAIKIMATVLGQLGTWARPLRPIFQGIGTVIGFIAAGPILRLLGGLKYIGIAFRIMAVPIAIANSGFRQLFKILSFGIGITIRLVGFWVKAHLMILRFVATLGGAGPKVARGALNIVGGVINTLEKLPGKVVGIARSVGSRLVSGIANGVRSKTGALVSFFGRIGKVILDAIVNAIKSAPGAIVGAISSIVPDKLKGAVRKITGAFAAGGVVNTPLQVVGEKGPELAAMPRGSRIMSNANMRAAVRGGQTMAPSRPIQLTANLHLSGRQIHKEVFTVERSALERT